VKLRLLAAALALAVASAFAGGCDGGLVHSFIAYPYNATVGCLEAAAAVDVIDGPDPGSCPGVSCWVKPSGEIFVSDKACDAPLDFTKNASGPCALALEAYKNRVMCDDAATDGGS
jgi:hypothetical protein